MRASDLTYKSPVTLSSHKFSSLITCQLFLSFWCFCQNDFVLEYSVSPFLMLPTTYQKHIILHFVCFFLIFPTICQNHLILNSSIGLFLMIPSICQNHRILHSSTGLFPMLPTICQNHRILHSSTGLFLMLPTICQNHSILHCSIGLFHLIFNSNSLLQILILTIFFHTAKRL